MMSHYKLTNKVEIEEKLVTLKWINDSMVDRSLCLNLLKPVYANITRFQ